MKQREAVTAVTVQRYRQSSKKMKRRILDEFCETTGYCRGYARFVLRNHGRQVWLRGKRVIVGDMRERQQRQKPRYYNDEVVGELIKLWELLNYSCGKRLVAIMPELIAKLEQFGELRLSPGSREKLSPKEKPKIMDAANDYETIATRFMDSFKTIPALEADMSATWQQFSSTEAGFKVQFPGTPQQSSAPAESLGIVHVAQYQSAALYSAMYIDYKETPKDLIALTELLDSLRLGELDQLVKQGITPRLVSEVSTSLGISRKASRPRDLQSYLP